MNTRDLEYLVAVVEQRSFSRAAEKCQASQPTLSAQIKKLEEQLGVVLLERNNKSVIPTSTGEQIARVAKKLLLRVSQIEDIAESASSPRSGNIRVGAFPTVAPYAFKALVDIVKSRLPEMTPILVEQKTEELLAGLNGGSLDAAFIALPVDTPRLTFKKIFDDEFLVVVPDEHPLTGEVTQDDLVKFKLILVEHGHCMRDQVSDYCKLLGLQTESQFEASSIETLKLMVKGGAGITLLPSLAVKVPEEGLRFLSFSHHPPKREIALVYRKTTLRQEVLDIIGEGLITHPDLNP